MLFFFKFLTLFFLLCVSTLYTAFAATSNNDFYIWLKSYKHTVVKKGISQEKGKWRTKIFEYYESGEDRKAWQIYNDWNSKRPTNPLMLEEVDLAAYYKWRIRKAMEAAKP